MATFAPLKYVLGKFISFTSTDTIPTNNLGTGAATNSTYLRGDGTWAAVSSGSSNWDGGDPATVPSPYESFDFGVL